MAFDDLLRKHAGEIGRYQCLVVLAMNLCTLPASFDTMEIIFTQATPLFWPKGQNVSSYNASHNDLCECVTDINGTLQKQPCTEWTYDDSQFESTLVTQFDLVCQQAWVPTLASSVYMLGFMGIFPMGFLSDRFGRRPCLVVSIIMNVISRTVQVWSPSVAVYIFARFFVGLSHIGRVSNAFVLATEFVGPSKRTVVGTLPNFTGVIGCVLAVGLAFVLRSRFYLELAATICMACTLPLLWFIPESPRWLSSQGRLTETYRILKQMARVNGRELPASDDQTLVQSLELQPEKTNATGTICKSLRKSISSKVIMFRTLVAAYCWLTISLVYYGLTLNSGKLAGDIYVNTLLVSLVEIPAAIIILLTLSSASGRVMSLCASKVLTGVFLLSSAPLAAGTAATVLSLLGKLCISYAFAGIYIYTCEIFPTTIRNVGFGFCSFSARIGSSLAPIVVSIFSRSMGGALLIGVMSLVAGLFLLCLPETRGKKLPQTISEAEAMKSFLLSRCCPSDQDDAKETPNEEVSI